MVMIGGEPGVGKTHLIGTVILEAARTARRLSPTSGTATRWKARRPMCPSSRCWSTPRSTALPKRRFRHVLGRRRTRRREADAGTAAACIPTSRRRFSSRPNSSADYLFNAYRAYVEREQSAPHSSSLVFEDLHWADEPTLLLLTASSPRRSLTTPVLIIGTYRDVELEVTRPVRQDARDVAAPEAGHAHFTAAARGRRSRRSMLAAMSGQHAAARRWRAWCSQETRRQPVSSWRKSSATSPRKASCSTTPAKWRPGLRADQLQVPEGVRLVLGRRLNRLGADARRILTTAAVIGRSFSLRLLEALENASTPDAALDADRRSGSAPIWFPPNPPRAAKHATALCTNWSARRWPKPYPLPRRQRLHARVAEAIERVYARQPRSAGVDNWRTICIRPGQQPIPKRPRPIFVMAAQTSQGGCGA